MQVGEINLNVMEESSDMDDHLTCSRVRPFRPCRDKPKTVRHFFLVKRLKNCTLYGTKVY